MHSKALVKMHLFDYVAESLVILGLSHTGQSKPSQAGLCQAWPGLARPGLAKHGLAGTLCHGGGLCINRIEGNPHAGGTLVMLSVDLPFRIILWA